MKIETLNANLQNLTSRETAEIRPPQRDSVRASGETVLDLAKPENREKLTELAGAMEQFLKVMGTELKFRIDEKTNLVQVEVFDPQKDKVIQKIPPDDLLKLAASIEDMVGVFVDKAF